MTEIQINGAIKDTPGLFNFPQDSLGIQQGKSFDHIIRLVKKKFTDKFGQNSEIKWSYMPCCPQSFNLESVQFVLKCKICSNMLIYRKNMNFQTVYRLVRMDRYHPHGIDQKYQRELNQKIRSEKLLSVDKYEKTSQKMNRIRRERSKIQNLQQFIRHLPHGLLNDTKAQLVQEHFGITYAEYQAKVKSIESDYDKNAVELFEHFNKCGYMCSYLPEDIVQQNQIILQNKKNQQKVILQLNFNKIKAYERINPKHWNLPNVLLIVTPQMKELYLRYGQYVGFDLTYSLIKEAPQLSKEYLVGVFGGTSESQRIAVYGLVITNNQSVEIYKYLFQEFIAIMGKQPQTIITDQQKSIYYALKQLKNEGKFHGYHLFDTFHILKKFRKASGYQGDNFQLFRQLIHAKNRSEYKNLFNKMLIQVRNDHQLEIIKSFDYNNAMYCISQIQKTFVGTGISDSPCEKIHDIIKQQLPHQVSYIKGILIILDVLKMRNSKIKYGFIQHFAVEQRFNMPFLKPYRLMLSRGVFKIFVKEVCKSAAHRIRNNTVDHFSTFKQEHLFKQINGDRLRPADIFFVDTKNGSFTVYKEFDKFPNQYKWKCLCQFQEKTGIPCSHIAKIILFTGENFYKNIHPRWFIKQDEIEQKSKNYGSKVKYLYKVRKTRPGIRKIRRQMRQKEKLKLTHQTQGAQGEGHSYQEKFFDDSVSTTSKITSKFDESALSIDDQYFQEDPQQSIKQKSQMDIDLNEFIQKEDDEDLKQPIIQKKKPKKKEHSAQQSQGNTLRNHIWNAKQKQQYLKFIICNMDLMKRQDSQSRELKYRLMSNNIQTRTRIQCQKYHQTRMSKYKTLQNLIIEFKFKRQSKNE